MSLVKYFRSSLAHLLSALLVSANLMQEKPFYFKLRCKMFHKSNCTP